MATVEFFMGLIVGILIVCLGVCVWHFKLVGLITYINRDDLNLEQEKKIARAVAIFCILFGMGIIIAVLLKPILGNNLYLILFSVMATYAIFLRIKIKYG